LPGSGIDEGLHSGAGFVAYCLIDSVTHKVPHFAV
jgi:hypothetical protein